MSGATLHAVRCDNRDNGAGHVVAHLAGGASPIHVGQTMVPESKTVNRSARILIVAEQPVLRFGLLRLLAKDSGIEPCGEAGTASAALREVGKSHPDLALVGMPLENRIDFRIIVELKAQHPPLKVLAGIRHDDPSFIRRLLRAGADGCICWSTPLAKIVEAATAVLRGDLYIGSPAAKLLMKSAVTGDPLLDDGVDSLTDREWDVFMMIGQGLTTQQIAKDLDVSTRTVESHRKKIKTKLRLYNAVQLNHIAYKSWQEIR
jgi:DNA-binding NarL/FixJ family response regulator